MYEDKVSHEFTPGVWEVLIDGKRVILSVNRRGVDILEKSDRFFLTVGNKVIFQVAPTSITKLVEF